MCLCNVLATLQREGLAVSEFPDPLGRCFREARETSSGRQSPVAFAEHDVLELTVTGHAFRVLWMRRVR